MAIKNFLGNKWLVAAAFLAVALLAVYSYPYWSVRPSSGEAWIFNTPDETANYFFAARLAQTGELSYNEPLNAVSEFNLVHPRGTTVVGDAVSPGGFLGFIILLGILGKIFSAGIIPYLTPIFSAAAVFVFYFLLKKIFDKKIALLSAILLAIQPAFWYYSSRSLFANAMFVDFLIFGFYFSALFFEKRKLAPIFFAGLSFGLALSMRMADAIWVAPLFIAIVVFNRKKFSIWQAIWFLSGAILPFVPVFYWQWRLFGSPWAFGYWPEAAALPKDNRFWSDLFNRFIAPFGLNPRNVVYNLYYYFAKMFWWQFWPAFLAGAWIVYEAIKGRLGRAQKGYWFMGLGSCLLVALYYGSWSFADNLMNMPLIGSSQARYFLPIYIWSLPLVAWLVFRLAGLLRADFWRKVFVSLTILLFFWCSFSVVWTKGAESLSAVVKTVHSYQAVAGQAMSLIDDGAVIISSYSDKVFFPTRRVAFYWREPKFLVDLEKISSSASIYFYDIDAGNEVGYIEKNSRFSAEKIFQANDRESLYRLSIK